jgi:hypothetical protein
MKMGIASLAAYDVVMSVIVQSARYRRLEDHGLRDIILLVSWMHLASIYVNSLCSNLLHNAATTLHFCYHATSTYSSLKFSHCTYTAMLNYKCDFDFLQSTQQNSSWVFEFDSVTF